MTRNIQETKDAVIFLILLANAVVKSREDGKTDARDILHFIPATIKLPAALENMDQIKDEIVDMDEAERAELVQEVQKLELRGKVTEKIVQESLVLAAGLGRVIGLIIRAKKDFDVHN